MADEADLGNHLMAQDMERLIAYAQNSAPGSRIKSFNGKCKVCNNPISPARLKALPNTGLCIRCAEDFERGELGEDDFED